MALHLDREQLYLITFNQPFLQRMSDENKVKQVQALPLIHGMKLSGSFFLFSLKTSQKILFDMVPRNVTLYVKSVCYSMYR